jgi:hypothetical protein
LPFNCPSTADRLVCLQTKGASAANGFLISAITKAWLGAKLIEMTGMHARRGGVMNKGCESMRLGAQQANDRQ